MPTWSGTLTDSFADNNCSDIDERALLFALESKLTPTL